MSEYSNNDTWALKIANANKWYEAWETKFRCRKLEEYYEGEQWKLKWQQIMPNYNPYVVNMVYSTIKQKLATLLFQRPKFILSPTPGTSSYDLDFAVTQTYLKQDVLNTIISNPNTDFVNNLRLCALDSFFRFGIMETGYAADWRNPQKQPIETASYTNPDIKKDRVVEMNEVPVNERVYVKRINPKRFRCGVSDASDLNDCNWVGYYEWILTSELKNTPGVNWPEDGAGSSIYTADYLNDSSWGGLSSSSADKAEFLRYIEAGKVSKVWHIWDSICHKRYLLLEDANFAELWSDDFEHLPLVDLRWDFRSEGFYPIPPVFQWLSPQDEINEAREQARSFRRRFTRKFQSVGNMIDGEEIVKFESGPDGVIINVKQKDAITPIQNPELPTVNMTELQVSRDDFSIVSGVSAEARGQVADRETATQATLTQQRAQIRESADQMDYSNFICNVGRQILTVAQERLDSGMWVKYTSDPDEMALQDVNQKPVYKWVHAQDIADGYDFTIEIDVMNNTPQMAAQAMQSFANFLAFVKNYPEIAMSPVLIREAAYRSGYRNERVIHQMQQVALASMAAKAQQQSLAGGQSLGERLNGGANGANAATSELSSQMALPSQQGITDQLSQQLQ